MDPLTDLGVAVAAEVATSSLAKIKKHAGYLYNYKDNLNALQDARVHLEAKRADASKFSDDTKRRLREVGSSVTHWQSDSDKLHQKAEELISRNGISCLNLRSRYSSSKLAQELTQAIDEKIRRAPDFGTSFDLLLSEGDKFNLKGYVEFESRQTILDGVLKALKDDDVSVCSICGMGGIGKTTMAKKLVKIVEADRLFDKVAMVTVSQNPNFENIQNEIIELLGLKFDVSSMPAKAKMLNDWLSKNKALLILDDVWWQVHDEDFDKIGIPLAAKGCKIVVTSRKEDECMKMEIERNFCLKVLDDGEAWDLFVQNVGKCVEERNLQDMARKIVSECDGLPIAIVTIARALKDKPRGEWNDSLKKLQMSNLQGISDMEKVFSKIQVSYDLLKDPEAQSCLRFCCLFREDHDVPVEKLVFYGIGLEYFESVDTLREARDRVDSIVHKLKNSFLLLDGEKDGCVKLHDIVRDFAIWISSKDENPYLLRFEEEMEKWPEDFLYEKCSAISFLCYRIKDHPLDLRCPNLKLLQLQFMYSQGKLPNGFFNGMEGLKVVDLQVQSTVPPLTKQKSLRTLLINCYGSTSYKWTGLGDVDMENLEIFSVTAMQMSEFPVEIGLMRNLKCLRFLKTSFWYMPPGVLSNLVKLEELELPLAFNYWGLQEFRGSRFNATLDEVVSLPLTSLSISLQKNLILAENMVKSLSSFRIFLGTPGSLYGGQQSEFNVDLNTLEVRKVDKCDVVVKWTSNLLSKCHQLSLEEVDFKYITSQQYRDNNGYPCTSFCQLKYLYLHLMESLEDIFHGPYLSNKQQPCFANLTNIRIYRCPKLKFAFPMSVAREFAQLQSMLIGSCNEMEEIFYQDSVDTRNQVTEESEVDQVVVLPQLKLMRLDEMPKLRAIYNGNPAIKCPSFEEFIVKDCHSIEGLCNDSFTAPGTEKIKIKRVRSLKIVKWLNLRHESGISRLTNLKIVKSREMKYLVDAITDDPNLLETFFSSLKDLFVEEMDSLQEIWHGPCLSKIQPPCFSSLTWIRISHCPKLKHLFPLSVATNLRALQGVKITQCQEMEEIFYNDQVQDGKQVASSAQPAAPAIEIASTETLQNPNDEKPGLHCPNPASFIRCFLPKSKQTKHNITRQATQESIEKVDEKGVDNVAALPQLKGLHLEGTPKLRAVYGGNQAIKCPSLEYLGVHGCNEMEALFYGSFNAPKTEKLDLKGVRDLKNVLKCLEQDDGILHLTKLKIFESHEMKYLLNDRYLLKAFFSSLKELTVIRMDSLIEIWRGPYLSNIQVQCFSNLTEIWMHECPKLKHLFPLSVATELRQLQELKILYCEEMEEIFYKDHVDDENQTMEVNSARLNEKEVIFPQLKLVDLSHLSKLRIFYNGNNHAIELPSLKSLMIFKCDGIKALSNGSFKAPKLKRMGIYDTTKDPSAREDLNTIVRKTLNIIKDEEKDTDGDENEDTESVTDKEENEQDDP